MSLLWKAYELEQLVKRSKTLTKCDRCQTRYKKTLNDCPACSELSDDDVKGLLQAKHDDIESMGKTMLYFLAVIASVFLLALIFD